MDVKIIQTIYQLNMFLNQNLILYIFLKTMDQDMQEIVVLLFQKAIILFF